MKSILLLHGALGSAYQLEPLKAALANSFDVHTLNLPGHGGTQAVDFSIPAFAAAVEQYISFNQLAKPVVFGYSMGGYVALYLANQAPDLLSAICTLATKFHWDEATAAKEVKRLNPDVMEQKIPQFAAQLKERHHPTDWKEVVQQTAQLLTDLGTTPLLNATDLQAIAVPVLVMLGDRDQMVTLEETANAYKALPAGQLAVLPQTPHPLEGVPIPLLSDIIHHFVNPLPL